MGEIVSELMTLKNLKEIDLNLILKNGLMVILNKKVFEIGERIQ